MRAVMDGLVQMSSVNVDRIKLLETVRKNREKHVAEYQQAVRDYKDVAIVKVTREVEKAFSLVEEAKAALLVKINKLTEDDISQMMKKQIVINHGIAFDLPVPQNHAKDYDAVISMLSMSVDETIELASDQHACFVLDDWDWKDDFLHSNRVYTSTKSALGIR